MAEKVPVFVVKIDGQEISTADDVVTEEESQLQMIRVELKRQAPSSVQIQFNNRDDSFGGGEKYAVGSTVSVKLGYTGGTPEPVFSGEIIGSVVGVAENSPRSYNLRAFDQLHHLTRGRKTRTFLEQKFSDIVSSVSTEYGLQADADDTQFKRDYVIQHNQTDLDFIRGIAGWLDYDLCIDHAQESGQNLKFKKPVVDGAGVVKAVYRTPNYSAGDISLRRFDVRQSMTRVVSKVIVRGWNPGQKSEIVGTASSSDVYSTMGGSTSGPDEVASKWGDTERQITDYKVFSQDEADAVAKTKLNEYARTFLRGDIEVEGDARLHPGKLIEVSAVGERYDGMYFIEAATHVFRAKVSRGGGYVTQLSVSRCGW